MNTIYAVYSDEWTRASEFYSNLATAQEALDSISKILSVSDLTIQELSVYDYNMEDN